MLSSNKSVLIIAEIGMNHDGSFGNACRMVDIAADCGADAVKFQTHISKAETLRNAPMPPYFKGEPRFEYFERTAFSLDQWKELKAYCDKKDVEFMSSPFSLEAVDLLEKVGMLQYKIPSGEVTNLPFLEKIAQTGKPIILSSGMSSWSELDSAVEAIQHYHNHLAVLQCTSAYPCPHEKVGLNVMLEMRERYKLPVGLSDHTLTNYASFTAVVLGASVIEKHFTLSKHMYGSDAKHSLEPKEFDDLVCGIRAIEEMLKARVDKDDIADFEFMKKTFEKSVVALVEIPKDRVVTGKMIGLKKPGGGIPPLKLHEVIGKRAKRNISANVTLTEADIEWSVK